MARLGWIALALMWLCTSGCQNNADRDLIARDRRLEEDQLYAMQDYISQYQQLVCRYRSENASLRRQLNEERTAPPSEAEPQPMPRTQPNWPAAKKGPTIETPPTPGTEKSRVSPPKIETPDVSPHNKSTSDDEDRYRTPASNESIASYDEPSGSGAGIAAASGNADEGAPTNGARRQASSQPSSDILLSGEVVANDSGGGPRMVVDVEPFGRSGRAAPFDGNVSLMLVSADADGRQKKLARWDFGPDDVRLALDSAANGRMMSFHVELPAGTKIDGATELWVRLTPTDGSKLLNHATVDLSRPGVFSSHTDKIWPSEESVVATSYEETSTAPSDVAAPINEGTWAVAEPGKPANLPPEADEGTGGWKATSEPLPAAVATATPAAAIRRERPQGTESKSGSHAGHVAVEVPRRPSWSPERSDKSTSVARPSWSPTR